MYKTPTTTAVRRAIPRAAALLLASLMAVFALYPGRGDAASIAGQPPTSFQAISPFEITGFIQAATLDNPNDTFSGGSMTVNGLLITIPRNTLMQFPATGMTWQEMFKLAPVPYGLANQPGGVPQSGLAIDDIPKPFSTYEVTVQGNRVIRSVADDRYIAGLVFLSQQSLNAAQGFINAIDYNTGELFVGSTLGAKTGARLRINTPRGRFGRGTALTDDVRFTADEDNPTIHADTGYPLCVPRTDPAVADDPLCPLRNRPGDPVTGFYLTNFTMPGPRAIFPGDVDPDPTQQAPLEVGDFIDYAGTLTKDSQCAPSAANKCEYMSVHTIVANLGIYTRPGTMPAYISIEDQLLGVGGTPNPLFPQEALEKLVMVAFTTDNTQVVDIYGVDVDACGSESSRFYSSADPHGPPIGGVRGRAVLRTFIGNFLPATREMRVTTRTLTGGSGNVDNVLASAASYANGLTAGVYTAPTFAFIFPERLILGGPPVAFAFNEFPFLVNGSGPYEGAVMNPKPGGGPWGNLGQLDPWPGLQAPLPLGCGPNNTLLKAPTANAGSNQTVNAATPLVVLDGTNSADTNSPALPIFYTWTQTGGQALTGQGLQDSGTAHPFFAAPTLAPGAPPLALTFSLVVTNGYTTSAISSVIVTVVGEQAPIISAGADQTVSPGALVTLHGTATDPNGPAGLPHTYSWTQSSGPSVTLTAANTLTPTFTAPQPSPGQGAQTFTFKLTVTNNLQLSSSATTKVTVRPFLDSVSIVTAQWRSRKSRLTVTATSSAGTGVPVLTVHVPNGPDLQMTYDPVANTYSLGLTGATVNPAPDFITVTSSFGGTATSPVVIRP